MPNKKKHNCSIYMKTSKVLCLSAFVFSSGSLYASEQDIVISYASPNPAGDPTQEAISWFMDEVSERSDDRVKFNTYLGNSLIKDQDVLNAVSDGMVDMGKIYTISYPGQLPLWNIGNLPFTHPDPGVLQKTLHSLSDTYPEFTEELGVLNIHGLGLIATGGTQIASTVPLETVEDLEGLKVRGRGVQAAAFSAANAAPASIPWNDTYEALSKGVVDATTTYLLSAKPARHHEVTDYFVSVDLGQAVQMEIINKDFWESLPSDIATLLTDVMHEAEERYASTAATSAVELRNELANDFQFVRWDKSEIEEWQQLSPDFFTEWAESNIEKGNTHKMVESFMENQAAYSKEADELGHSDIW